MWKSELKYSQINQETRNYEVSKNSLFLHLKSSYIAQYENKEGIAHSQLMRCLLRFINEMHTWEKQGEITV